MWTRKDLRQRGRETFKRNYWRSVLVAFLFVLITGAASIFSSSSSVASNMGMRAGKTDEEFAPEEHDVTIDADGEDGLIIRIDDSIYELDPNQDEEEISDAFKQMRADIGIDDASDDSSPFTNVVAFLIFSVVMIVVFAIVITLAAFLINPVEIGVKRFFYKNLDENSDVAEIAYGYDHNYLNNVKILFMRDLQLAGWFLLFIIPGIVKCYEYRMIPYLLAEDPTMSKAEVFARSKEMMNGQKWKTFLLDLSFLGWDILSLWTLGLLSIFYVAPYKFATEAALYETLRYGSDDQAMIEEKIDEV